MREDRGNRKVETTSSLRWIRTPRSGQTRTTMTELVLPDHLAPLLGSAEFIDVVGTSDPWVVPDGWLEDTQQELRRLVERLGPGRAGETSSPYRPGLPRTLPFLWSAITYLPTP